MSFDVFGYYKKKSTRKTEKNEHAQSYYGEEHC